MPQRRVSGKKESDALVPAPLAISDNKQDNAFMSMMQNTGFSPTSNIKERTLTVFQNSFWQIIFVEVFTEVFT